MDFEGSDRRTNVGELERIASAAVGGWLVYYAVRKRSLSSVVSGVIGADLLYRGISGHCGLYEATGLSTANTGKSGIEISADSPSVEKSITIGRSRDELYDFWRNDQNLARIHGHFAEVTPVDHKTTHWRAKVPLRQSFEWDSVLTVEEPGEQISWMSLPGTHFPNEGTITFRPAPGGRGTEVKLTQRFEPPLSPVSSAIAKVFRFLPAAITDKALRRFKSLVETGEIPTLAHNPSARGTSDSF